MPRGKRLPALALSLARRNVQGFPLSPRLAASTRTREANGIRGASLTSKEMSLICFERENVFYIRQYAVAAAKMSTRSGNA